MFKALLTSALDGDEPSASRPGHVTLGKRIPCTHWTSGWIESKAGLDATEDRNVSCFCRKSNLYSSAVQPVARNSNIGFSLFYTRSIGLREKLLR
jgi:hypothetical protein